MNKGNYQAPSASWPSHKGCGSILDLTSETNNYLALQKSLQTCIQFSCLWCTVVCSVKSKTDLQPFLERSDILHFLSFEAYKESKLGKNLSFETRRGCILVKKIFYGQHGSYRILGGELKDFSRTKSFLQGLNFAT